MRPSLDLMLVPSVSLALLALGGMMDSRLVRSSVRMIFPGPFVSVIFSTRFPAAMSLRVMNLVPFFALDS